MPVMRRMVSFLVAVMTPVMLAAAGLTFSAPDGWRAQPTSSSMRVAQFALPREPGDAADAELVVYYFGGSGGSVEANIERWVGQMQQPAGRPSRSAATRETRTVNGLAVSLVEVGGTYVAEMSPGNPARHNSPNYRLRAAVVQTPGGPYFIKLTGPARTVDAQSRAFDGFIASLQYRP